MKKILLPLVCIVYSFSTNAQTVDEILTKYEVANGGNVVFNAVKTLQYNSIIKINMMGMPLELGISNVIEKGKIFRKDIAGLMGMKGSYTLVTDTAGFISSPSIPSYGEFQGMEGGIKKMDKETLLKAKKNLVPMQEFTALLDAKANGATVTYIGNAKVDKVDCYKIKLTNLDGNDITYFIDIATNLTKQVEVTGKQIVSLFGLDGGGPMAEMMGGNFDKQKVLLIYTEYLDIKGLKFPAKQKIQLGAVDVELENADVQINEPIDPKYYLAK
jgi:hypothetical protein